MTWHRPALQMLSHHMALFLCLWRSRRDFVLHVANSLGSMGLPLGLGLADLSQLLPGSANAEISGQYPCWQ